jgi:glutaredoxin 3
MNKIIVKLYTTPACPYCFTLREFLKENGVDFEEIDVSQDEKVRDDMIKKSGQMGAPVVEIGGEVIVGFDKAKITKLLGLKK